MIEPLLRWLAERGGAAQIELACGDHGDPAHGDPGPTVVVLPGCVGTLSVASCLELVAAGVGRLTVTVAGCPAAERTAAVLAEAQGLLGPAGVVTTAWAGRPRLRATYPLHRLPISRRRLLLPGRPRAENRTDRERAAAALRALRSRAADLTVRGCTLCGVCVRACPAEALALRPDGAGRLALVQDLAACTGCGRCAEMCPERALTRGNATPEDRPERTLASSAVRRCARCRAVVPGAVSGDLCEVCAFRQANPFGRRTPGPELRAALSVHTEPRF